MTSCGFALWLSNCFCYLYYFMKNAKLLFTLKEHFFKNCQILRESHVKAFCSLVIFSLGFFFNLGLIFYLGFLREGDIRASSLMQEAHSLLNNNQ